MSEVEDKVQYEIEFDLKTSPAAVKPMMKYLSRKDYEPSFSHSEDRLSGILSVNKQLTDDHYEMLEGTPLTKKVVLISSFSTGSENSEESQ